KAGCLIGSDSFSNPRWQSLVVNDQDAFLPASGQCCRFTAVNRLDHGMWVDEAHAELSAWNAHAWAAKSQDQRPVFRRRQAKILEAEIDEPSLKKSQRNGQVSKEVRVRHFRDHMLLGPVVKAIGFKALQPRPHCDRSGHHVLPCWHSITI